MERELIRNLQLVAAAFIEGRQLGYSTLGRLAAGDWRFFDHLDSGKTFTARKYDQVMRWFADNWPAAARWPDDVPRPEPLPVSTDVVEVER